ncbi:hypothetical protein HJC23_000281 [Cyclotella cryptica]|uniref:Uncharacterized protein n=1 Tax=Cyclotella cryptica TaxID=29204 RepID=A0ABD3QE29_9STRA
MVLTTAKESANSRATRSTEQQDSPEETAPSVEIEHDAELADGSENVDDI